MKRTFSLILSVLMAVSVFSGMNFSSYADSTDYVEDCRHTHTELRDYKEATYDEPGYTGDIVCVDCGQIVDCGRPRDRLVRQGWQKIDDVWYLYDYKGNMLYGWQEVDGVKYYLDESTGEMKTGWLKLDDVWYFFLSSGAMATDWAKDGDYWYYLDPETGAMQTGWIKVRGNWFYLRPSGSMVVGLKHIDELLYYFNNYGVMQKGWQQVSGKWYYFNGSGAAVKNGWLNVKGNWFYMNQNGVMLTGWQKIKGNWFYLNNYGVMQTGWTKVKGNWFYMNKYGVMQTGWIKLSGKYYYLNSYGVMQTGWTKIGGKYYYFDSKGVWRKGFNNVYEYYSSNYVNNYNRTRNLEIASAAINGTIIEPGEIFDFNAVVGPRTSAKGYLPAPVFTGSTGHADETGGGICQVASTIFNAALYANFDIVERHQHSQRVYYVPLGRDAAIYSTVNNFRFRNTSPYPIKIGMTVSGGVITCTFYTEEYASPASVSLNVSQSGNNFTLRRYVNGSCNYTARSNY